jgi:hypothetical protein
MHGTPSESSIDRSAFRGSHPGYNIHDTSSLENAPTAYSIRKRKSRIRGQLSPPSGPELMRQISWNTNRVSTNNCRLIYIVFLVTESIFDNEKFVYVGNQLVTFVIEIDLAIILITRFESRFAAGPLQRHQTF